MHWLTFFSQISVSLVAPSLTTAWLAAEWKGLLQVSRQFTGGRSQSREGNLGVREIMRTNQMRSTSIGLFLAGLAVCGTSIFLAHGQAPPPIRVSDNHRYLVTRDGKPFFYLADTAWGLFNMNHDDIDLYLKDRADKKFTVIQAVAANYTGLDRPNPDGATVFTKAVPAGTAAGTKLEPNPAYFKNVDYAVDKANSLGMYVAMVAIWGKSYVNEKHSIFDKTTAYSYGRFLATATVTSGSSLSWAAIGIRRARRTFGGRWLPA